MNKEKILDYYCENSMKRLKVLADKVMKKIAGNYNILGFERDEYYSIANDTLFKCLYFSFDEERNDSFEGFLIHCISNKFKSYLEHRNKESTVPRDKMVMIDSEQPDGELLYDIIPSDYNIEDDIRAFTYSYHEDERFANYFRNLTKDQTQIILLLEKSYTYEEIEAILHISHEYMLQQAGLLRSYEYRKYIFCKDL